MIWDVMGFTEGILESKGMNEDEKSSINKVLYKQGKIMSNIFSTDDSLQSISSIYY